MKGAEEVLGSYGREMWKDTLWLLRVTAVISTNSHRSILLQLKALCKKSKNELTYYHNTMKIARNKGASILSRVPTMKTEFQNSRVFWRHVCKDNRAMNCFAFKHGQDSVALFIDCISLQSFASVTVQIVEMFHLRIKMRKT